MCECREFTHFIQSCVVWPLALRTCIWSDSKRLACNRSQTETSNLLAFDTGVFFYLCERQYATRISISPCQHIVYLIQSEQLLWILDLQYYDPERPSFIRIKPLLKWLPKKLSQTLYFIKLDSSPENSFSKYKLHKKKTKKFLVLSCFPVQIYILKSRYIYLRSKMTQNFKSCFLKMYQNKVT